MSSGQRSLQPARAIIDGFEGIAIRLLREETRRHSVRVVIARKR
ncbi:hypothetical protein [Sphingomonas endolithica]|nr:hypothetical protein [Sphingomonas sp. ZFBP2030]